MLAFFKGQIKAFKKYLSGLPDGRTKRFFLMLMAHEECLRFTKHSVATGFGWGMFWMMIPMPLQTVPSCITSFLLRGNIPIAAATVWISNPFTMVPMFTADYFIGVHTLQLLGFSEYTPLNMDAIRALVEMSQKLDLVGLLENVKHLIIPTYLGSVVIGATLLAVGYILVYSLWRLALILRSRSIKKHRRSHI